MFEKAIRKEMKLSIITINYNNASGLRRTLDSVAAQRLDGVEKTGATLEVEHIIIDGNVTTLIAGVVLFIFGTGLIKSFATTLMVGIIISMFTALVITRLGLKAFVAAVLGGIGSIPGAMLGGFAIGLCEVLVTSLGGSAWTDAVVFAILIVVLLIKPTGFMGKAMSEKV